MKEPETVDTERGSVLAPAHWLGGRSLVDISSRVPFGLLIGSLCKRVVQLPTVARLNLRILSLNFLKRRIRLRIVLNRTRIICLKRRYLFPEKGDLIADSWFARAGVYHPVEVVKVFFECFHKYWSGALRPNDQAQRPLADSDAGRKGKHE